MTMERVSDDEPLRFTSAQDALDKATEELNEIKRGPGRPRKEV